MAGAYCPVLQGAERKAAKSTATGRTKKKILQPDDTCGTNAGGVAELNTEKSREMGDQNSGKSLLVDRGNGAGLSLQGPSLKAIRPIPAKEGEYPRCGEKGKYSPHG